MRRGDRGRGRMVVDMVGLMVVQGMGSRGVVSDVRDGHGGGGGDREDGLVDLVVAAVVGYDHVVVVRVVRHRGGDERVRGGRRDDMMD